MIHRINVFLLSVIIILAPAYSMASLGSGPWDYDYKKAKRWAVKFESMIGKDKFTRILTSRGEKDIIVNGSKRTISAIAQTQIGTQKVGAVMLKRINQVAAGGAVGILGVVAVQELLEGIGWVMEEGTYVKKEIPENASDTPYLWKPSYDYPQFDCYNQADCVNKMTQLSKYKFDIGIDSSKTIYTSCDYQGTNLKCVGTSNGDYRENTIGRFPNPNYGQDPKDPIKHPLTFDNLGCLIFAACYSDPVDPSIDSTVNTQQPHDDIIKNAATPDEKAGEDDQSNPISSDVNKSLEEAPKTTEKDGTDGKSDSETKPKVDPETGEQSQETKGDFKLPAFCDWATYVCDWIDWTQDDEIPDKDNSDMDADIPVPTKTVDVIFGSSCPPPASIPFSMGGYSSSIPLINFDPLCAQAPIVKPSIIALASIGAAFIIFGRGKSE